jgi:hypothetical protein
MPLIGQLAFLELERLTRWKESNSRHFINDTDRLWRWRSLPPAVQPMLVRK